MDIRNIRELKNTAAQRLEAARDAKRIILIYACIITAASLLVTVICYCLSLKISQSGGLSNMGTRTFLSTLETVLPIVLNLAILCLELGFVAAMIRISRGLYTSPQTLRAGMPRFWAAVRCSLLLSMRYLAVVLGCFYLATMIYALTPLSNAAVEILMPYVSEMTTLDSSIVIDNATALQLADAMIPLLMIFGVLFLLAAIPMFYRYRMANYILMDNPRAGAFVALQESKKMMRGNGFALFKLDLSLWWYYVLGAAAAAVCYADLLLPLVGVALPFSSHVSYFLTYGVYLAAQFAIYWFFQNKVGVTYALAYEALRPKDENNGGVVLGNIFNM